MSLTMMSEKESIIQLLRVAQKTEFVMQNESLKQYIKKYYGLEQLPDDTVGWCSMFMKRVLPDIEIFVDRLAGSVAKTLRLQGLYSEEAFFGYFLTALNMVLVHELIHFYGETIDEQVVDDLVDEVTQWLMSEAAMTWKYIICPRLSGPVTWTTCLACNDHEKHPGCPLRSIRAQASRREYTLGKYHVSELIKPRYAFYERLNPSTKSFDEYWDMFLGTAVGDYIEKRYSSTQFEFDTPVVDICKYLGVPAEAGDEEMTILGHADVVDTEQGLLIELKTMADLKYVLNEPKPEHAFQVGAYWLLGQVQFPETFSKFTEARVVYIGRERPKRRGQPRYIEHVVDVSKAVDLIVPARLLHHGLKQNRAPNVECSDWLCRYCDSAAKCYEEFKIAEGANVE